MNQKKQSDKSFYRQNINNQNNYRLQSKIYHFNKRAIHDDKLSSFEGESIQTQNNFLCYRVDLYFHDYKLAIEIDENGYSDPDLKK